MERKMKGGFIAILGAILIALILIYPSFHTYRWNGGGQNTKIIISRDFGKDVLEIKTVNPGKSVIKTLESIANITTAYGGKFVTSINGLMQNGSYFWFYYVNGIYANVGAAKYIIHPGDIIRWDFHKWIPGRVVYGEIEDFPEPLIHGYNGFVYNTTIVYQRSYKNYAEELKNYLTKMRVNVTMSLSFSKKNDENLIILGYPAPVADDLNKIYNKLGWTYHVENGKIVDNTGSLFNGAFAQLSQSPYNPRGLGACQNIVIWIYATDSEYMSDCINDLIHGNIHSFWYFVGENV